MFSAAAGRRAAPLLVLGCVIFSLGSLIVRVVPVGAYAVAMWRLVVAGVIFAVLMRFSGQKLPGSRRALRHALTAGFFLALDLAFWHESIHAVGPGISTLLNGLQIFFLSAAGLVFFGEKPGRVQLVSLVAATVGVAMIAWPEFGRNSRALWGFVSGILSGAMLACSMIFVRKTHQAEKTALFPLMFLISVAGVLTLVLPSLLIDAGRLYPTVLRDAVLILIYGAVMQCFAWGLIVYAIPLLSLSLTGLLLLSEPVAALAVDYFLLDKAVSAVQWGGAVLTMAAIYLGSLKPGKTD